MSYIVFTPPSPWKGDGHLPTVDGDKLPYDLQVEDLLQISRDNIIIDIGWYPQHESRGAFIGMVVKDYYWDTPLEMLETRSAKELADWLNDSINRFNR